MRYILALDQGTTSSRAILFDESFRPVVTAQAEFAQHFPQPDWVEYEAADLWQTTLEVSREVIEKNDKRLSLLASPINGKPRSCGMGRQVNPFIGRSSGRIAAPRRPAPN
jgi:glycerol kinase